MYFTPGNVLYNVYIILDEIFFKLIVFVHIVSFIFSREITFYPIINNYKKSRTFLIHPSIGS